MRISPPILDAPSRCGYLPDRPWRLEYRIAAELAAAEYAELLLLGWRHFGRALFRPRCPGCSACTPIRVDVARFRPDRSQRRAGARNAGDLALSIAEPTAGGRPSRSTTSRSSTTRSPSASGASPSGTS